MVFAMVLLPAILPRGDLTAAEAAVDGRVSANSAHDRIHVEHDREAFRTTIRVPTDGGRLAWADLARGFAKARGYDDRALLGVFPNETVDLTSWTWRWTLVGLNLALQPDISFSVDRSATGGPQHLVVQLDRAALLASQRRFKELLSEGLLRILPGQRTPRCLELSPNWEELRGEGNLVIFVHGMHSGETAATRFVDLLLQRRVSCGVLEYPNDQPIEKSARLLARELQGLADEHPGLKISLLTHSMGGLVARAVVEDPGLDPGNVTQLIMVAPPNHGSQLARFAFAMELWEHVASDVDRRTVERFYRSIEDGLSEASADLTPDSLFLRGLNGRDRNPRVQYTIILGTGGPLREKDLARMRTALSNTDASNRWFLFFKSRLTQLLGDLDEVVAGKGDGVVAVSRGRLDGVEDTVLLEFGHLDLLDVPESGESGPLHRLVLDRLGEKCSMPR